MARAAGAEIAFHVCGPLIERSRQTKKDRTSSQKVRRRLKLNPNSQIEGPWSVPTR